MEIIVQISIDFLLFYKFSMKFEVLRFFCAPRRVTHEFNRFIFYFVQISVDISNFSQIDDFSDIDPIFSAACAVKCRFWHPQISPSKGKTWVEWIHLSFLQIFDKFEVLRFFLCTPKGKTWVEWIHLSLFTNFL